METSVEFSVFIETVLIFSIMIFRKKKVWYISDFSWAITSLDPFGKLETGHQLDFDKLVNKLFILLYFLLGKYTRPF